MPSRSPRGSLLAVMRLLATSAAAFAAAMLLTPTPAAGQIAAVGGYNNVLGIHLAAGRVLTLAPGASLILGAAYAEATGTDLLAVLTVARPLPGGWRASFEASHGALGGDYRVDRLPEASLAAGGRIAASLFQYGLELGAGFYRVRPAGVSGFRAQALARLSTVPIPLGRVLSVSAEAGYWQAAYGSAGHGAGWGIVRLGAALSTDTLLTLTYARQVTTGASPLRFDALSPDHSLTASFAVRPASGIVLTHSQTYSLLTSGVSNRIYRLSVERGGHGLFLSWDQIEQKASLFYRWSPP